MLIHKQLMDHLTINGSDKYEERSKWKCEICLQVWSSYFLFNFFIFSILNRCYLLIRSLMYLVYNESGTDDTLWLCVKPRPGELQCLYDFMDSHLHSCHACSLYNISSTPLFYSSNIELIQDLRRSMESLYQVSERFFIIIIIIHSL